ncbi:MAG: YHS domain-containing protein [Planctomycetota bacterium]|mgnify:CR=1 FL=1
MSKILIIGLILTGLFSGCNTDTQSVRTGKHSAGERCGPETTAPETKANIPDSQPAPTTSELGQKVKCAVMPQNEFTLMRSSSLLEYQGKRYYFCCGGCQETFKKNPEKYIK